MIQFTLITSFLFLLSNCTNSKLSSKRGFFMSNGGGKEYFDLIDSISYCKASTIKTFCVEESRIDSSSKSIKIYFTSSGLDESGLVEKNKNIIVITKIDGIPTVLKDFPASGKLISRGHWDRKGLMCQFIGTTEWVDRYEIVGRSFSMRIPCDYLNFTN